MTARSRLGVPGKNPDHRDFVAARFPGTGDAILEHLFRKQGFGYFAESLFFEKFRTPGQRENTRDLEFPRFFQAPLREDMYQEAEMMKRIVLIGLLLAVAAPAALAGGSENRDLFQAISRGDRSGVESALRHGADPYAKMIDGRTAIDLAEQKDLTGIIGLLKAHTPEETPTPVPAAPKPDVPKTAGVNAGP